MSQDEIVQAEVVSDPTRDDRPANWREGLVVVALVVLADATIYRGRGHAGHALLLAAAPLLLWWGAPSRLSGRRCRSVGGSHLASLLFLFVLLWVLAAKLVWCGAVLPVVLGCLLLMAYALALAGTVPYVIEILVFPARMMLGGMLGVAAYTRAARRPGRLVARFGWLSVLLPAAAFVAFSVLFILANPDLLDTFGRRVERLLSGFRRWLIDTSPHPVEIAFWLCAAWVSLGLLRPLLSRPLFDEIMLQGSEGKQVAVAPRPSPFYAAARNTLITVLVLFAIYLVFEFRTLWFREFPAGFYYAGYAHQGAAWLTVALALATLILSIVFRGSILREPRLKTLRRLAWFWSLENILLAVAVYHRLSIYVGFNGLTRMRVVGFLGITAVLIGFLLVVWKIARNHGFVWLMRRHSWTLSLAIYLYAVLPVDAIVVRYNVGRILAGDSAPSVQITEQPIRAEGVWLLAPLLECDDAMVREGVRALLAGRWQDAERGWKRRDIAGWTSFQLADWLLLRQLRALDEQLSPYVDAERRQATYEAFRHYAYQWY